MHGPPLSNQEVASYLEKDITGLIGLGLCRDQAMLVTADRLGRHQADIRWMLDRFGSRPSVGGAS